MTEEVSPEQKAARDQIRMALSGQTEEPVKINAETDHGDEAPTPAPPHSHGKPKMPEFDRQGMFVNSLLTKIASLTGENAMLQAIVAEREAIIEANAELLGITIDRPHEH